MPGARGLAGGAERLRVAAIPHVTRQSNATSLSSRLVPSAGNPLGNTVSEREADDQSNCNF
jgi:hypothetical protein